MFKTLTRKELYALVWAKPMSDLAKEFEMSDVGLKKICKAVYVPTPPHCYWAKFKNGKKVAKTVLPTLYPFQSQMVYFGRQRNRYGWTAEREMSFEELAVMQLPDPPTFDCTFEEAKANIEALVPNIPNLKKGRIPDALYYDKIYGHHAWAFSTIYSLSIGQGEMGIIPLQMANIAAIFANKGYFYTPHFVKAIGKNKTINPLYLKKNLTKVRDKYFQVVADAMYEVVNEPGGTASQARIDSIVVCGKTGTAQNPHGEDHSIFIAFAPRVNPKIAIAVYIENAGFGGVWAAPIASLMIEKYIRKSIKGDKRKDLEERMINANLMSKH